MEIKQKLAHVKGRERITMETKGTNKRTGKECKIGMRMKVWKHKELMMDKG
jgi:hypothetical protein